MNEFRDDVIAYRNKHGLTQQEMADRCGLSRQTINSIERKPYYRVNIPTRHKLDAVLNEDKKES